MYRTDKNIDDVNYIINNLRLEDKEEISCLLGENWKQKAFDSIYNTDFHILIGKTKRGDVPVLMGGAWETDPIKASGVACVWLLSTDEIKNYQICFLREMMKEFKKYDEKYWLTYNIIHKNNHMAKKWLKRFGFKFDIKTLDGAELPKDFEFFYRIRPVKGLC